jgi:hypothetical protein
MLKIWRNGSVIASFGLLASIILLPAGIVRTPAVALKPASYVLGARDSARLHGYVASSAQPVGYDADVIDQSNPASYVGAIEDGGATSLREDVNWSFIEAVQGQFDWTPLDGIVAQAAQDHLHVLLIVDTSPLWASGGSYSNPDWKWLPPRNPADYGEFAAAVAARYGPGGAFWQENPQVPRYLLAGLELWNEENLSSFWGGLPPNPALYAAMVTAAYPLIKQADPSMTVVTGGLSPSGGYNEIICTDPGSGGFDGQSWNPLNYLQALYNDGIGGSFDAVGWHPYYYWPGATAAQMLAYGRCSAWSQMASTPVSVRSLMIANGDGGKRIWITETGAPTCIAYAIYSCVDQTQQADLAYQEARQWQTLSWAGGFYWYDIEDTDSASQYLDAHFGAVSSWGSPKPAYWALQQAWSTAPN